jgi:hypothetical protein
MRTDALVNIIAGDLFSSTGSKYSTLAGGYEPMQVASIIAGDCELRPALSVLYLVNETVLVKKVKKPVARSTCLGKYNSW